MAPRWSVIVPTRARPDLLARCLERLAPGAQHLAAADYEVVVADDGDDDTTRALLTARFPFVVHVAGPRRGPAANRNAGARAARAEWLAFTDDDCLPDAGWLAAFDAAREGHDALEGRTTCAAGLHSPRDVAPVNEQGGCWWSCNVAVRREPFLALGGFDERFPHPFFEDVDLDMRMQQARWRRRFVREAVVDHPPRRRAGGAATGRLHRSRVLLEVLHDRPMDRLTLLRLLLPTRLAEVARAPLSRDGVAHLAATVVESLVVLRDYGRWEAEARAALARGR